MDEPAGGFSGGVGLSAVVLAPVLPTSAQGPLSFRSVGGTTYGLPLQESFSQLGSAFWMPSEAFMNCGASSFGGLETEG